MGKLPSKHHTAVSGQRLALAAFRGAFQAGTATLVGGTVTVTGAELTADSVILLSRNTTGGTIGDLSAASASRNAGASTFDIDSVSGTDTSTVDWAIIG